MATIAFHIQPRASKTEVVGRHGDAIKIRVKSPPVDGAANMELVRFLAKTLAIGKSEITIRSGATGRRKTLAIADMSEEEIERRLGVERAKG